MSKQRVTKDLGAAIFRLRRSADNLWCRGSGATGYGGSIKADLLAVIYALEDFLDGKRTSESVTGDGR